MPTQTRVSELPAITGVTGTDLLIVSSNSATKRVAISQIGDYFVSAGVAGPTGASSTDVGTGAYSTIAGGSNNVANTDYATVGGGSTNTASGFAATVCGGDTNTSSGFAAIVGGGYSNTASGDYSGVIGGQSAIATVANSRALASGKFGSSSAVAGTAQMMEFVLRTITTAGNSGSLTLDGNPSQSGSNCAVIPIKTTWAFTAKVAAYSVTDDAGAAWTITGALRRDAAGTTAIVGANTAATVTEAALSTATCVVVADATNNAIKITATGISSKTIRWCAHVSVAVATG